MIRCGTNAPREEPYTAFRNPQRVTIRGYSDEAMEPFLTGDGRYLLFNNSNAAPDTNLHYAERIDDITFDYRGEIAGANSPALDAVPSVDFAGNLYFISTRSYDQTLSTVYRGRFRSGRVTDVALIPGLSKQRRGDLIFDVEVSADGNTLIFSDGVFRGGSVPRSAELAVAVRDAAGRFHRLDGNAMTRVNTSALQYAASISANELFFTRVMHGTPAVYRTTRRSAHDPWDTPQRVQAITGFAEAPALLADGRTLYYHARRGGRFVIERVTR